MHWPGVELAIFGSLVRRPNHYTTEPPKYRLQRQIRGVGLGWSPRKPSQIHRRNLHFQTSIKLRVRFGVCWCYPTTHSTPTSPDPLTHHPQSPLIIPLRISANPKTPRDQVPILSHPLPRLWFAAAADDDIMMVLMFMFVFHLMQSYYSSINTSACRRYSLFVCWLVGWLVRWHPATGSK